MAEKIQWVYNMLQLLIVFISLSYGIIYWQKIKQHGYFLLFPIYTAVSLSTTLLWFVKNIDFPGVLIENIFIAFELVIFYNFFIKVFKEKRVYIILICLCALFFISLILGAVLLYSHQNEYMNIITFFNHFGFTELVVIEEIFVVIPILLYYISLFNRPYINNLSEDPIFLVMTGMLFCMVSSLPIFVFSKVIINYDRPLLIYLYIINSVAYIVMHLFFIKAYQSIK